MYSTRARPRSRRPRRPQRRTTLQSRASLTVITVLERGDIFFLYRPRVETVEVGGQEDVQRLFMVLAADREGRTFYRLFAIGRKQLPQVRPGEAHLEERNWARCVRTTPDADELRPELLARTYPTATRGGRLVGAAKAVGEGRYQLVLHRGHSELAYVLELRCRRSSRSRGRQATSWP